MCCVISKPWSSYLVHLVHGIGLATCAVDPDPDWPCSQSTGPVWWGTMCSMHPGLTPGKCAQCWVQPMPCMQRVGLGPVDGISPTMHGLDYMTPWARSEIDKKYWVARTSVPGGTSQVQGRCVLQGTLRVNLITRFRVWKDFLPKSNWNGI